MTYQRGTDLPSCPKDCEFARSERTSYATVKSPRGRRGWFTAREQYDYRCFARSNDTCPREQDEKRVEKSCSNCSNKERKHFCFVCWGRDMWRMAANDE